LKKNVTSVLDYSLDSFKILKMVHQGEKEEFDTAKMKVSHNQSRKYTLVKVKDGKVKGYERDMKVGGEIGKMMAKKERKMFLKISCVWKEKKQWLVAMDNYLSPH